MTLNSYKTYVTKFVLYLILFIQLREWFLSKKKNKIWRMNESWEREESSELRDYCLKTNGVNFVW